MQVFTTYDPAASLTRRYFSLAYEGIKEKPTLANHQPELVEKMGSALLFIPTKIPTILRKIFTNPQVVITLTWFLLSSFVSLCFYPLHCFACASFIVSYLPDINYDFIRESLRFSAWLFSVIMITGYSLRAFGRLNDKYIEALIKGRESMA